MDLTNVSFSSLIYLVGDAVTAKLSEMSLDSIGHIKMGIVFLLIGNSERCLYNTQSILIGCLTLSQEYCKLIGVYWRLMRKQL